jgi:hypothetical protein
MARATNADFSGLNVLSPVHGYDPLMRPAAAASTEIRQELSAGLNRPQKMLLRL